MASLSEVSDNTLVVDSIHGDIHLKPLERRIIDTPSFQRLRQIKQLGMGQITYPNATHTRFAHSLGVLGVMERVVQVAKKSLNLSEEQEEDIRLAGLLHDIGHYPYSHLMESLDKVVLTEEFIEKESVRDKNVLDVSTPKYPKHEELGQLILTKQQDLIKAIGGPGHAQRIASLFTRGSVDSLHLSNLINSSLDMDRLDYLLRDAHATGVPYGQIDLNYLLNSLKISPEGILGVSEKALAAAEQSLLARFFMYRTVYYHKTTYGMEEACRHLLRRIRDTGKYEIAADGNVIRTIVASEKLEEFNDAYVDRLIVEASKDRDPVIRSLADTIRKRRPPKLLKEVCVLEENGRDYHAGIVFKQNCKHKLANIAKEHQIPLGQFLFCPIKRLTFEQRGSKLTEKQARDLDPKEEEELIKIFVRGEEEPVSIVNIGHSIISLCSNHFFQVFRLYVVYDGNDRDTKIKELSEAVKDWDKTE